MGNAHPFFFAAWGIWSLSIIALACLALDRRIGWRVVYAVPLCWLMGYMPWWYMARMGGGW